MEIIREKNSINSAVRIPSNAHTHTHHVLQHQHNLKYFFVAATGQISAYISQHKKKIILFVSDKLFLFQRIFGCRKKTIRKKMTLDTPSTNELYQLIGSSPTSSKFKEFTSSTTTDPPTITKLSNYVYHAYKPIGISFCFIPSSSSSSSELVLDAIDVYNGSTRDGFSQFTLIDKLPCGLKNEMQAHEIVSLLGEPDRKGGGGQSRLPCWIEYKFNSSENEKDSGVLIQLHGFEWEDREMGWTSFVLY